MTLCASHIYRRISYPKQKYLKLLTPISELDTLSVRYYRVIELGPQSSRTRIAIFTSNGKLSLIAPRQNQNQPSAPLFSFLVLHLGMNKNRTLSRSNSHSESREIYLQRRCNHFPLELNNFARLTSDMLTFGNRMRLKSVRTDTGGDFIC